MGCDRISSSEPLTLVKQQGNKMRFITCSLLRVFGCLMEYVTHPPKKEGHRHRNQVET